MNTRHIPQNSTEENRNGGTVYIYTNIRGKPAAVAYTGRRNKPAWNFYFYSEEQRRLKIEEFFSGCEARENFIQERKQERKSFKHGYKVGDILSGSWGYEQTNREFYQVIEVSDKSIVICEIAQKGVDGTQGFMSESRTAVKDDFIGKPRRAIVRPQKDGKGFTETYVDNDPNNCKVYLSEWNGRPEYASWYA